jgi:hypothetical protein
MYIVEMETPTKTSSYTPARKDAYLRNKDAIAQTETEKKRWIEYYAKNKEAISERRKKNRALLEKRPIDETKIQRYNELMLEATALKKEVSLKKLRETLARKRQVLPTPDSPVERTPRSGTA